MEKSLEFGRKRETPVAGQHVERFDAEAITRDEQTARRQSQIAKLHIPLKRSKQSRPIVRTRPGSPQCRCRCETETLSLQFGSEFAEVVDFSVVRNHVAAAFGSLG